LPPRLNGRRDKKHSRGGAHASTNDELLSVSATSSVAAIPSEVMTKIENWDNEVLPKIEKWNNDMAMNIPSVIASEPLPPRSKL